MRQRMALWLALILCLGLAASGIAARAEGDAWVQVVRETELRKAAHQEAPVIRVIPKGADLDYLGKSRDGKWIKVAYRGKTGWIDSRDGKVQWSTIY